MQRKLLGEGCACRSHQHTLEFKRVQQGFQGRALMGFIGFKGGLDDRHTLLPGVQLDLGLQSESPHRRHQVEEGGIAGCLGHLQTQCCGERLELRMPQMASSGRSHWG